jgi:hypothetical protein
MRCFSGTKKVNESFNGDLCQKLKGGGEFAEELWMQSGR